MRTVDPEFDFGEIVYLKVPPGEGNKVGGQVVSYRVYPGSIQYDVDWGDRECGSYYGFQLTNSPFLSNEEI